LIALSQSHDVDIAADYDDGPDWPNQSPEKERAFRRGFLEEARRVVREWADPDDGTFDPWGEEEAARQLRRRVRERFSVYAPGRAGPKTHHLGYRPGHAAPAARLRGRHHAMAYVTQSWDEVEDLDAFDRLVLPAWLTAVERWAEEPISTRDPAAPPMPLEIERAEIVKTAKQPPVSLMQCISKQPFPRRLELTRADQIEMRPPDWLLRGVLERDTFALVFGDPGCGKSFVAIDWAARIATGTPWRGHTVRAGPVVYVAGEGQQGFGRRIRAWSENAGVEMAGAPLFVAPAVAIPQPAELASLFAAIDAAAGRPTLVVLDTLARCFGGGDENSTQDMSRFVSACDAIRRRYGCTILVVHHTGHAEKMRARGAIALKAALDAEYRLDKTEPGLTLTATKMKDAETPPPLAMELVSVELPGMLDEYGNPITSAAVEVIDADVGALVSKAKAMPGKRGKQQAAGLDIMRRLATEGDGRASAKAWHRECRAGGMQKSTRYSVLAKLQAQGAIEVDGDWLIPRDSCRPSKSSPIVQSP